MITLQEAKPWVDWGFVLFLLAYDIWQRRRRHMNLVEALLKADEKKLVEIPTEKIEIKRLTKLVGEPFVIEVSGVSNKRVHEIQEACTITKRHGKTVTDTYKVNLLLMVEGIKTSFNDKDVLKKYNCATVKDLYEKLFNVGEVTRIVQTISELSGISQEDQEEEIEEVKN
jgi:hypothetical protein